MDWADRLRDWAEDAVDCGGGDGIFDDVGDFLGEQVDGSWAQGLVDAGADGVIDELGGVESQPAVDEPVATFEADPEPSHLPGT